MAQILDKQGLQHYANKMCNADNRKVGTKSLPTALNEIDTAIDGFKTLFESEYSNPINMEIVNSKNSFSVGAGNNTSRINDVENSFTDIKIGGNTLVNIALPSKEKTFFKSDRRYALGSATRFKPNTTYTVFFNVSKLALDGAESITILAEIIQFNNHGTTLCKVKANGIHKGKFTTSAKSTSGGDFQLKGSSQQWDDVQSTTRSITISNVIVLEGDLTDQIALQYFEGLKSIGEKTNKAQINITSINKNLIFDTAELKNANEEWVAFNGKVVKGYSNNVGYTVKYSGSSTYVDSLSQKIYDCNINNNRILPDTWYTLSFYAKGNRLQTFIYPAIVDTNAKGIANGIETTLVADGRCTHSLNNDWRRYTFTFKTKANIVPAQYTWNRVLFRANPNDDSVISCIMLEQGKIATEYEPNIIDKKEIVLNEPLRGLPNGIRDTIEKINDEWKIIRRCAKETLNGQELGWAKHPDLSGTNVFFFYIDTKSSTSLSTGATKSDNSIRYIQSDSIACYAMINRLNNRDNSIEGIYYSDRLNPLIQIHINKSKLTSHDVDGFKTWLSQNPVTVLYELETYIIEDIDPITLQCWKNGTISIADEAIPVETTHTVALNKSAQIQKNIEELTSLRNKVKILEEQYSKTALNQAYETELLKLDMKLNNII